MITGEKFREARQIRQAPGRAEQCQNAGANDPVPWHFQRKKPADHDATAELQRAFEKAGRMGSVQKEVRRDTEAENGRAAGE